MKVSKNNAEHYVWGNLCDGWHLVKTDELSIIHEKMPPGTSEVRHFHTKSKQFFFMLSGQAAIEVNNVITLLNEKEGIEIQAKTPHQIFNKTDSDIEFLVISMPPTAGDKIIIK